MFFFLSLATRPDDPYLVSNGQVYFRFLFAGRHRYQRPLRPQPKLLPESLSNALSLIQRPKRPLSKSITYELNADVSLTRGIIYDALDVKEEMDVTRIKTRGIPDSLKRGRGASDKDIVEMRREELESKRVAKDIMKKSMEGKEATTVPTREILGRKVDVEMLKRDSEELEVKEEVSPPPEKRRRSRRMLKLEAQGTQVVLALERVYLMSVGRRHFPFNRFIY